MIIFAWIVFSIVVAVLADNRGRNSFIWFFLSIITSPAIAGLLILCMRNIKAEKEAERRHKELLEAAKFGIEREVSSAD
jgi:hypothetical protein